MCPLMLESLLSCVFISDVSEVVDVVGKGDMVRNEVRGEILTTTVAGLCAVDPSVHRQYLLVSIPDQLTYPHAMYIHGWLAWASVLLYTHFMSC